MCPARSRLQPRAVNADPMRAPPIPGSDLYTVIAAQAHSAPVGPELTVLGEHLQQRYGEHLAAILFYGSCLRSGDALDGLVDLYVLVSGYRHSGQGLLRNGLNWLLPPNVFYLELPLANGARVRAKYALLSLPQLKRGTSKRWFQTYLWGRFAQPTALLYARDPTAEQVVVSALGQAALTLVGRALPSLPEHFDARGLWQGALALSYATELRAERSNRKQELFDSYPEHYLALTRALLPLLPCVVTPQGISGEYRSAIPAGVRRRNRLAWALRRLQGKGLSLLRLSKALLTFQGGVDYILWKLERHSGVSIEAPPRVRRYPLIFGWGLLWRLYRRGVFR